ncbi:hypothetical protein, partial [Nostoc sp.]
MPSAGFSTRGYANAYAFLSNAKAQRKRRERCLPRASLREATPTPTHCGDLAIAFLSHAESEESDAYGGLLYERLRQRLRFFNEPQRHRVHRVRRGAMPLAGFAYAEFWNCLVYCSYRLYTQAIYE